MSEWISVKNRLPEQYTDVIVLYDFGRVGINWTNKENEFVEYADRIVTHWMPLPKLPKKNNAEYRMTDKELLEAAKAISDNCKSREKCEGCPFEHTGETYLDNFCIVQEGIRHWEEFIEEVQEDA